MRLVRSANLAAYWRGGQFVVEEFVRHCRITTVPLTLLVLELFTKPRSLRVACRLLDGFSPSSVAREVGRLARLGFIVRAGAQGSERQVGADWGDSFAAAYYHFATRNVPYLRPRAELRQLRARLAQEPQPASYKDYRGCARQPLVTAAPDVQPAMTLHAALGARRTVRRFGSAAVSLAVLSDLVRGTWGQTGWLDGGILGPRIAKTNPSAGARHPIECYVVAWRVEGLTPGLYHYAVRTNVLERLRTGDFSTEAVSLGGGQRWIRSAAFVCIMTAVARRVFWKYGSADAYRLFFLDAGHLGQTFALLATAHGLRAFTTAALSEMRIEALLGLDGESEFPVYLCGAGQPVRSRPGVPASPAFRALPATSVTSGPSRRRR